MTTEFPAKTAGDGPRVIQDIDLATVVRSKFQIRDEADADIDSLAADMAANGLVQPVTVRRVKYGGMQGAGDVFEIVAGHRRAAAARALGWTTVPAVVVEADDDAAERMLVAENFARRDLTPLEIADTAAALVERHGAAEAGRICGKSERWAQRMAYIAGRLSDEWRAIAKACGFSQASLSALAKQSPVAQADTLKRFCDDLQAADWKALLEMAGKGTVDAFLNGGDVDELEYYGDPDCDIARFPWTICGCGDCDGCHSRTDAMPLLDGETDECPQCTNAGCRNGKYKEWNAWRGKQEWERKLGTTVAALPPKVDIWRGDTERRNDKNVPVLVPAEKYGAGTVRWFAENDLKPEQKKKPKETYPTTEETRETAYCETVREWLAECDDAATLQRFVVALCFYAPINGTAVYGAADRLEAVEALSVDDIMAEFSALIREKAKDFLSLGAGRTGHTEHEMKAAKAMARQLCAGSPQALDGLKAEAAALADRRLAAIAEAKRAAKRRK